MIVAVVRENFPGEQRVALVPGSVPNLIKAGATVLIEKGAGTAAGFPDQLYLDKGAQLIESRQEAFQKADVIFQVRSYGANPDAGKADLDFMKPGQIVIGMADPLGNLTAIQEVATRQARLFALEMIPRITRAQSMDVLSSQATIAGYRAVLLAAIHLPKMYPMLMTAAGTLSPARVFVIGAGVAGLQAIATAKRLGAVVTAYDVRPEAKEQIESLGAKCALLQLESEGAQDKGGYAKDLGEEFYTKQREFMGQICSESDVVITTAAIPGRKSPLLVTTDGIKRMAPGSVAIDLAAERGGNIEPSEPDQAVTLDGITILGPTNLASEIPNHASQMFSHNITKFLLNMVKDKQLHVNMDDEIVAGTIATSDGEVVNGRLREMLNLPPLSPPPPPDAEPTPESTEQEKPNDS
ncbi:NAD(P)(+) transhydrogenase (Re/Si-specific) subunit alpha [Blastopirellula marina]|uniref:proton-translocating NAD(P)(+) transhydrogenase n=1 Tax=Blastopirellula marina TaxID=124 RepID=A0A2S8G755_9BACT|nr:MULTISPECIES: NAD(P) transhydrogenase subunit alpha [Pirellulaceae]PQO40269.1 NAD(P)(+) transhydrogenase (Re/Si-specific) subunit alpha [Blastopirellula marina]RCS55817.1 NAD(P) transhydrogenase subunit alpha [Bremerella cremea]